MSSFGVGRRDKSDLRSGSDQLRTERRVGATGGAADPQRRLLQLLSGTVPRPDRDSQDPSQDALLHVQRRPALHDDVGADPPGLLPTTGIGREDRFRRHCSARLLRLHAGHRREDARDL